MQKCQKAEFWTWINIISWCEMISIFSFSIMHLNHFKRIFELFFWTLGVFAQYCHFEGFGFKKYYGRKTWQVKIPPTTHTPHTLKGILTYFLFQPFYYIFFLNEKYNVDCLKVGVKFRRWFRYRQVFIYCI